MACAGCAKRKAALVKAAKQIVRTPQAAIQRIRERLAERGTR